MNAPVLLAEARQRHRLRASDFEVLHEAGALQDLRKAELIDGDIYTMSPQTTRHGLLKTELGFQIRTRLKALRPDLVTIVEVSVVVADDSVPEPDIVVSSYKGAQFMPADTVLLAVEVASSTLAVDLGRKAALYASAGVPILGGRCRLMRSSIMRSPGRTAIAGKPTWCSGTNWYPSPSGPERRERFPSSDPRRREQVR
ncbi:Uma2 family endonuclease [Sphingomonas sp. MMS24-JH45]